MNDAFPQKSKDSIHNICHNFKSFDWSEEIPVRKMVGEGVLAEFLNNIIEITLLVKVKKLNHIGRGYFFQEENF